MQQVGRRQRATTAGRTRRLLVRLAAVVAVLGASVTAGGTPAQAAAPTIGVTGAPDDKGGYLAGEPLTISGSWADPDGAKEVRLYLYSLDRHEYLTARGTWQAGGSYLRPAVTVTDSGLDYALDPLVLTAGSYRVMARGVTVDGALGELGMSLLSVTDGPTDPPPTGPYLTIMFGRSQWSLVEACKELPGTKTLEDALALLDTRGMVGVGGVVLRRTAETKRICDATRIMYPTWADLARLRDTYGTVFVSQSKTYTSWKKLTTEAQFAAETCDTLPVLSDHGHTRAWGMFNYPDNVLTPNGSSIPGSLVAKCFAFGRKYGAPATTNSLESIGKAPYQVATASVTGGSCNNAKLACYRPKDAASRRYKVPTTFTGVLQPASGRYGVIQFYRFVEGSRAKGDVTWDCSSKDPLDHWTSTSETYCWNDFITALDLIPEGVTVTDPATVAQAIGRLPTGTG